MTQNRIAFIHPFLFRYPRGIERYTLRLANVLAQRGVEVTLLTWRWKAPIQIEELDSRVCVHFMPTSRYYAAAAVVPFYIHDLWSNDYDFVWIFFAGYGEAEALRLWRRQRFGIVFHYPITQVPHRYREFRRYGLAKRAEQLVSVSRYVASGVREYFGRESPVIPHGVDTNRFRPDPTARVCVRESLNVAQDTLLLVTAAALEERKGIQWVLQALPRVLRDFPKTTYLILGDGPYRAALEQQVRGQSLEESVLFLGALQDVTPFYQAADISLILARGEASSFAALESMACSVPVIASEEPPFEELVTPDCGTLVNESDRLEVAEAIAVLLCDAARRHALGEAGRARVLANFNWDDVGDRYLTLLNSAAPG